MALTLKQLIDSEPSNSGASDAVRLAWLQENVVIQTSVTYTDLLIWASEQNIGYKISQELKLYNSGPGNGTSTRTNGVIGDFIVLDMALRSGAEFDLSKDQLRTLINNLVGNGISAPNRAALFALSDKNIPRWRLSDETSEPTLQRVSEVR